MTVRDGVTSLRTVMRGSGSRLLVIPGAAQRRPGFHPYRGENSEPGRYSMERLTSNPELENCCRNHDLIAAAMAPAKIAEARKLARGWTPK